MPYAGCKNINKLYGSLTKEESDFHLLGLALICGDAFNSKDMNFNKDQYFVRVQWKKWRIKLYFLSNVLNFTVVWHTIKYYYDF